MNGKWKLPPNYISIRIVGGLVAHRYRISYQGRDPLVNVNCDKLKMSLLSGMTRSGKRSNNNFPHLNGVSQ